jgi:hypothetical protein
MTRIFPMSYNQSMVKGMKDFRQKATSPWKKELMPPSTLAEAKREMTSRALSDKQVRRQINPKGLKVTGG